MKDIKVLKEPGYMYDLFYIFILKFNRDYCLSHFINNSKVNEETEYINSIATEFDEISDKLFLFFHLKDSGKCLMTEMYLEPYKETFANGYCLDKVKDALLDYEQVIKNVIRFYFADLELEYICSYSESILKIGNLIDGSKYDDTVKSKLFSFFINPIPVISQLVQELSEKEIELDKYYQEHLDEMDLLRHNFVFEQVSEQLLALQYIQYDCSCFDSIYVTFCMIAKNIICFLFKDENAFLILGRDYEGILHYLTNTSLASELDIFGSAIAEKNRIDILEFIHKAGEVTIKEVEDQLGFTSANSYYHLTLMIKANILKTRNQGRTILYSVNKEYFNIVCDVLSKYSK